MEYKKLSEEIINALENIREEMKDDPQKTYTGFEIIQIIESIIDIQEEYK